MAATARNVVGVIDAGLGNVGSVLNMLRYLDVETDRVAQPTDVDHVNRLVLPGVGHFDAGRRRLRETGLDETVIAAADSGMPVLGICLGMQLLTRGSDEGTSRGLGLIDVRCRSIRAALGPESPLTVPHMGWNTVAFDDGFLGLAKSRNRRFYFVHSYAVESLCGVVRGRTRYGVEFGSVVSRGAVIGAQFHPEKSHRYGMEFLRAWIDHC